VKNQTAIVTGASRGIGATIATTLAAARFTTILIGRDAEALNSVTESIKAEGGLAFAISCDITDKNAVQAAFRSIKQVGPAPSVLVNNAGLGGPFRLTTEVSDEEWEAVFSTNMRAAFWFCREYLPPMKEAGYGRIVNIASIYGLVGGEYSSLYSASKHALVGYTKSIGREWGAFGITSNALCPGFVETEMHSYSDSDEVRPRLGPIGTPTGAIEIAETVLFLMQPMAKHINGATIAIDGGDAAGFPFQIAKASEA
jgi:3-oxoacyl-[acyl-carrier protein] reductase